MIQEIKLIKIIVLINSLLTAQNIQGEKTAMEDVYKYQIVKAGKIKPKGWIKDQLESDLSKGYIGVYDDVHPTVTFNVFVNQNRKSKRTYRFQKEWWSGEHEGYWKDAVVRMAYLVNDPKYKERAKSWMYEIIDNAGEDGYIGIYDDCKEEGCRYNHVRGNGELWATSRILMAMLAYYEFTDDKKVLNAAKDAIELVMKKYKDENYFKLTSKGGGISHGIGFFECLEWIYRITDDKKYLDFSVKLYDDFNKGTVRDDDFKLKYLKDTNRKLHKHGAHVAEGMFVPRFIASIVNEPTYTTAADNLIDKLEYHLTPGGAMRCDEWVNGRKGTADEHYEYCGIAELVSPLNKMIAMSGNYTLADWIENMVFNAGQGARFSELTALSYLTTDNRVHIKHRDITKRELYDAAHRAAACCALNGGRLMPYFVEGMWMKGVDGNSVEAMLLGPSELNTTINEIPTQIIENTEYPFSDNIEFTINPSKENEFTFCIRKPHGCENYKVDAPDGAELKELDEKISIKHTWSRGNKVSVKFDFDIEKIKQPASKTVKKAGAFIKRGPLVFALPFDYSHKTILEYQKSGFYRHKMRVKDKEKWKYMLSSNQTFELKRDGIDKDQPVWEENNPKLWLDGKLRKMNGERISVKLIPMGNTVFRRVTFSLYDEW